MKDAGTRKPHRIGVVVPVFNVEKTIEKVLTSLSSVLARADFEFLIIDNHSTDRTLELIKGYLEGAPALAARTTVICHDANYGYGCSIKAGFSYFGERDVAYVMIIHGDHQVAPDWLMGRMLDGLSGMPDADIVLASRFESSSNVEEYSLVRKFGNHFFNLMTLLCSGHRMSDAGTAMIMVLNDTLRTVKYETYSNTWQFHPQLNIAFYGIPGIRIQKVPMDWSNSDADSTIPLVRYGLILLRMLVVHWFKRRILHKAVHETFPSDPMPAYRSYQVWASPRQARERSEIVP